MIAACALAGTARADGDPASDYLLGTQVFFSIDVKLPKAKQQELVSIVRDANKSGYAIRVALIASPYDLGAVTSLWRKPRQYAKFLGAELQFIYKRRLLIVMPNGFGFNWPKHPSSKEYAVLSKVPIGNWRRRHARFGSDGGAEARRGVGRQGRADARRRQPRRAVAASRIAAC